ncbi:hypothetical protein V6N13_131003 [Hibiscus sabdariffa]|uniref:Uncharacterized protein n=1 Tax=Hibiscus sabdariffa TaxID=183260 RepID=A0ABR2D9C7_9ROSI
MSCNAMVVVGKCARTEGEFSMKVKMWYLLASCGEEPMLKKHGMCILTSFLAYLEDVCREKLPAEVDIRSIGLNAPSATKTKVPPRVCSEASEQVWESERELLSCEH